MSEYNRFQHPTDSSKDPFDLSDMSKEEKAGYMRLLLTVMTKSWAKVKKEAEEHESGPSQQSYNNYYADLSAWSGASNELSKAGISGYPTGWMEWSQASREDPGYPTGWMELPQASSSWEDPVRSNKCSVLSVANKILQFSGRSRYISTTDKEEINEEDEFDPASKQGGGVS
ncbi:uncharacterized protein I206_107603 [Kwoniella pini CBS 10737]|uniref:Uncharacterized protein n=1 Tax=Kwoniella pini CBS 10737 TaxID=1296096 RepID=A0A1B9HXR5_9TREE|nr:uncharacterized protein I206_05936 [Kwoniella pini CBS 10737]OCF48069.1 hypothetical protein I206_05936 [Kwoniella pini CBS 10737]